MEFTSGDKATPASPIAPERESGDTVRKGTAVGMALAVLPLVLVVPEPTVWATTVVAPNPTPKKHKVNFTKCFIKFIAVIYELFLNITVIKCNVGAASFVYGCQHLKGKKAQ